MAGCEGGRIGAVVPPALAARAICVSEKGLAHRNGDGATTGTSTVASVFEADLSKLGDHGGAPANSKTPDTVEPRARYVTMK